MYTSLTHFLSPRIFHGFDLKSVVSRIEREYADGLGHRSERDANEQHTREGHVNEQERMVSGRFCPSLPSSILGFSTRQHRY